MSLAKAKESVTVTLRDKVYSKVGTPLKVLVIVSNPSHVGKPDPSTC